MIRAVLKRAGFIFGACTLISVFEMVGVNRSAGSSAGLMMFAVGSLALAFVAYVWYDHLYGKRKP